MLSSRQSLIITFMGPVLLGALSLAAYGCGSSNDNTGGTKSTSCNAKPSGCKPGTTCWIGLSGGYACLPAKAGAGQGATCNNIIGQPQCDHGLACFPGATGSASGTCMPFCDQGGCGTGELCSQLILSNSPNAGNILVCRPGPTTDGGSDAQAPDAGKTDSGSDATATDSGSDATATDSGSDATATDATAD